MAAPEEIDPLERAIRGFTLREIGPALMGGRIADIAVHPTDPSTWFVAVGSGGVWKTTNRGITWTPVFDEQRSFSIGCVRIDPTRPEVVWVGTGEAVSGRHVAWGDGVYKSIDGGSSWTSMGLAASEHVSEILVDPRDGDVVYVAAEGPLWSSGGERGLYKTVDGGASWDRILHVDDDTGVTSVAFAPDDPDTVYAATYQRRRRAWSFLAGGPGSGIHVSNDGGAVFTRIEAGLPKADMGRIGLATTPADPTRVYATIEAGEEDQRGFYRSTNRGRTWERRSGYLSGGTGPHYYQELFASPTDPDLVYQVDVFLHATRDGGTSFDRVETGTGKHSDNHVVWIDPIDGRHLIVGCDAGLYETFDEGDAWRHVSNLPISQFYRVAVDHSTPFANVLAGAQDLGTLRGPTRTLHLDGVRNQDWMVVLGADGYHVAFDPEDERISYAAIQTGEFRRHDRSTMELTDVKPVPAAGDPPERWNWDSPLLISPHDAATIYVASQRVWRSDDRGDSWTAISPDLTTDPNRYELPVAGRVGSVDQVYDHAAMSLYGTITALDESPVVPGLLYVGTDDGRLHVSEDGGGTWRAMTRPDGLAEEAYVNDVVASRHDADVVIVAADDHKSGDYRPLLYRSADRGHTWESIAGDLPDGSIVWSVEQDHERADMLFVAAERGVFTTLDGGTRWLRLPMPTISVRDLAIQRRDDDLVVGTFGRGIHVLDDYGPLRTLVDRIAAPVALCPVRDAWWYVPYQPMQAPGQPTLGDTAFRVANPEFGATFTYHLAADIETATERRRAAERAAADAGQDVPFPGWDVLRAERLASDPAVVLRVSDEAGRVVRLLPAERKAGLHRTTWDLRRPAHEPISLDPVGFREPWDRPPDGPLVPPGTYRVEIVRLDTGGEPERLAGPETFEVRPIPQVAAAHDGDADFGETVVDLARQVAGAVAQLKRLRDRVRHLREAALRTPGGSHLLGPVDAVSRDLDVLAFSLSGDADRERLDEARSPSIKGLVDRVVWTHFDTTAPPTRTQRDAIERAGAEFGRFEADRDVVLATIDALTAELDHAGAPWTPR